MTSRQRSENHHKTKRMLKNWTHENFTTSMTAGS
eukprot:CAMPEP_0175916158 /NCGR_PEP_ID=MMETSP0108-20121206/10694_1 /TAXON_ID=195067 ORGANISM="Goniomonas pacifica, Strain CCMP1869" /NCGR_SAMPLE_ID=MMETSP0108 /ASSEMBLY_ACC=CAM_ASM_000204 /LENGTH=33 /DNA_ID= /DNA_START= /DNA_END= /DNA_ORIENTATION=